MPNEVRQKLVHMTQVEGLSIYKARKVLGLKYSTAKHIVSIYKSTGKVDRINAITNGVRTTQLPSPEKEEEINFPTRDESSKIFPEFVAELDSAARAKEEQERWK